MSDLPSLFADETLEEMLKDAMDVDKSQNIGGYETEIPESVKMKNVADTLADYIAQNAPRIPEIESTELMFGSGDSGRQSQLYLLSDDNVSKNELRKVASELGMILDEIFPMKFITGVTSEYTVNKNGNPEETDNLAVFLVYRARTTTNPSQPAGQSTEVIYRS